MSEAVEYKLLSNSKVKTWRRCPNAFRYKYKMGLRPKAKALPLERGTWLHALLETHFDGEDWRKKHRELKKEFDNYFDEEKEELGDLPAECERIMLSYLMHYKGEDDHTKVIDTELDEIVTLPNGLRFRMIIDKIIEEPDGGLWIVDYKTVKNFLPPEFLLLDAQLARYFWGAKQLGYEPLRGIIFDEISTQAPTIPEQLKNGELTKRKNIKCDVYTYYREIKRLGLDPKDYREHLLMLRNRADEWFRRTPLAKDAPLVQQLMRELVWSAKEIKRAEENDEYPRTVEKACRWDCSFFEICQLELMGGDIDSTIKLRYDQKERTVEA